MLAKATDASKTVKGMASQQSQCTDLPQQAECGVAELRLTNCVDNALDHRDNGMHVEGRQSLGHRHVDVNSTRMKNKR